MFGRLLLKQLASDPNPSAKILNSQSFFFVFISNLHASTTSVKIALKRAEEKKKVNIASIPTSKSVYQISLSKTSGYTIKISRGE